jgi:hypothetical protein
MKTKNSIKARRFLALIAAAIAVMAVAPGVASAKPKVVHADVSLWMQYQPAGNGVAKGFLFGGVTSDFGACKKTTINISREKNFDPNTWDYVWGFENVTPQDSGFTRYLESSDRGYQYTLTTDKKVVKKNGKKIICGYGVMNDVVDAY